MPRQTPEDWSQVRSASERVVGFGSHEGSLSEEGHRADV